MSLPLLEHTARLTPTLQRLHYTLGFGGFSYADRGSRDELFAAYAYRLRDTFSGLFGMSTREAWAEANEILEGADVRWGYLRVGDSYHESGTAGAADPVSGRAGWSASGTC